MRKTTNLLWCWADSVFSAMHYIIMLVRWWGKKEGLAQNLHKILIGLIGVLHRNACGSAVVCTYASNAYGIVVICCIPQICVTTTWTLLVWIYDHQRTQRCLYTFNKSQQPNARADTFIFHHSQSLYICLSRATKIHAVNNEKNLFLWFIEQSLTFRSDLRNLWMWEWTWQIFNIVIYVWMAIHGHTRARTSMWACSQKDRAHNICGEPLELFDLLHVNVLEFCDSK